MKKIITKHIWDVADGFTGLIEDTDGNKAWYKNGNLHRSDGPAVEYSTGMKQWVKNGMPHRLDGPAIIYSSGEKQWLVNNKLHRLDGPAIIHPDGERKSHVYYINDVKISKKEFAKRTQLVKHQLPKRNTDYKHLSDEQWYEYLNILVLE